MGGMFRIRVFALALIGAGYRLLFVLAVRNYERSKTLWRCYQERPGVPGLGHARVGSASLPRPSKR